MSPDPNSRIIRIRINGLLGGEGSTALARPLPLAPTKAFSPSGCGRVFPLFPGDMRVGLLTGTRPKGRARVLSGPKPSGPFGRTAFG